MVNTIQMTQTGYDELAKELEELKTMLPKTSRRK